MYEAHHEFEQIHRRTSVLTATEYIRRRRRAGEEEEQASWDVNAIPGESRDVSIDTRSGSWMSVDVSPDGQSIAFDLLGDIYVLPIEGGEAQSINSGHSWSIQPRFSPDGSEIAFTSDAGGGDNIWIMKSDGSDARQLTKEDFRLLNNPSWSPDGEYIAAKKHFTTTRSLGTGEIWLYHRNGGGGVAVVERPNEKHQKALGETAFSPDGRYIYYSLDQTPGESFVYAQDSNGEVMAIRRFDLQKGESELFVSGAGGAVRPTPSPDGNFRSTNPWRKRVVPERSRQWRGVPDFRRTRQRPAGSLGHSRSLSRDGLDARLREHRFLGGRKYQTR